MITPQALLNVLAKIYIDHTKSSHTATREMSKLLKIIRTLHSTLTGQELFGRDGFAVVEFQGIQAVTNFLQSSPLAVQLIDWESVNYQNAATNHHLLTLVEELTTHVHNAFFTFEDPASQYPAGAADVAESDEGSSDEGSTAPAPQASGGWGIGSLFAKVGAGAGAAVAGVARAVTAPARWVLGTGAVPAPAVPIELLATNAAQEYFTSTSLPQYISDGLLPVSPDILATATASSLRPDQHRAFLDAYTDEFAALLDKHNFPRCRAAHGFVSANGPSTSIQVSPTSYWGSVAALSHFAADEAPQPPQPSLGDMGAGEADLDPVALAQRDFFHFYSLYTRDPSSRNLPHSRPTVLLYMAASSPAGAQAFVQAYLDAYAAALVAHGFTGQWDAQQSMMIATPTAAYSHAARPPAVAAHLAPTQTPLPLPQPQPILAFEAPTGPSHTVAQTAPSSGAERAGLEIAGLTAQALTRSTPASAEEQDALRRAAEAAEALGEKEAKIYFVQAYGEFIRGRGLPHSPLYNQVAPLASIDASNQKNFISSYCFKYRHLLETLRFGWSEGQDRMLATLIAPPSEHAMLDDTQFAPYLPVVPVVSLNHATLAPLSESNVIGYDQMLSQLAGLQSPAMFVLHHQAALHYALLLVEPNPGSAPTFHIIDGMPGPISSLAQALQGLLDAVNPALNGSGAGPTIHYHGLGVQVHTGDNTCGHIVIALAQAFAVTTHQNVTTFLANPNLLPAVTVSAFQVLGQIEHPGAAQASVASANAHHSATAAPVLPTKPLNGTAPQGLTDTASPSLSAPAPGGPAAASPLVSATITNPTSLDTEHAATASSGTDDLHTAAVDLSHMTEVQASCMSSSTKARLASSRTVSQVANVLSSVSSFEASCVLSILIPATASDILSIMTVNQAAGILSSMSPSKASHILSTMTAAQASAILFPMNPSCSRAILWYQPEYISAMAAAPAGVTQPDAAPAGPIALPIELALHAGSTHTAAPAIAPAAPALSSISIPAAVVMQAHTEATPAAALHHAAALHPAPPLVQSMLHPQPIAADVVAQQALSNGTASQGAEDPAVVGPSILGFDGAAQGSHFGDVL